MQKLKRRLGAFAGLLAATAALAALAASPAAAEELEATFSAGTAKLVTSGITVERNGADPKACTVNKGYTGGPAGGNTALLSNDVSYRTVFSCGGGTTLRMLTVARAFFDDEAETYGLRFDDESGTYNASPWGDYIQVTDGETTASFVNGSGGTSSTVSFQDEPIGFLSETLEELTITGTFKATTSTGGLLTLSH